MLVKVKRPFLFKATSSIGSRTFLLVAACTALIAATYGLVRLAFGLHLPEISADLGIDAASAGAAPAAGSLVYGAAAAAGFLFGERYPRALVVAAAVTAGGGSLGMASAQEPTSFFFWSAVSSAGAGLASPAIVRIVHRGVPVRDRAPMQSIANAGTGPGLVAAGLIAWAIVPDWRLAWVIAAAATVVAAAAILALDRSRRAPRGRSVRLPPLSWWVSHRVPLVATVLFGVSAAAVWNFGRVVLVEAGAPEALSVLAWVLLGCGGAAVILTAPLTRTVTSRRLWLISAASSALGTAAVGLFPDDPVLAGSGCALFGWGYVMATGALIGWTTQIDPDRAAAGTAMLFVVFMIGQAVGATVLGAMLAHVDAALGFSAAAAVGCVAGTLGLSRAGSHLDRSPDDSA